MRFELTTPTLATGSARTLPAGPSLVRAAACIRLVSEAGEEQRGAIWKFHSKLEFAPHRFDMAPERRDQEIGLFFKPNNVGLSLTCLLGQLMLREFPRLAKPPKCVLLLDKGLPTSLYTCAPPRRQLAKHFI
jgi:hypothetical protein